MTGKMDVFHVGLRRLLRRVVTANVTTMVHIVAGYAIQPHLEAEISISGLIQDEQ